MGEGIRDGVRGDVRGGCKGGSGGRGVERRGAGMAQVEKK